MKEPPTRLIRHCNTCGAARQCSHRGSTVFHCRCIVPYCGITVCNNFSGFGFPSFHACSWHDWPIFIHRILILLWMFWFGKHHGPPDRSAGHITEDFWHVQIDVQFSFWRFNLKTQATISRLTKPVSSSHAGFCLPFRVNSGTFYSILITGIFIFFCQTIQVIQIIAPWTKKAFDNTSDKITCDGAQTRP